MGLDGEELLFSPYHMQLVDGSDELAALDGALDVVPASNLSEYVLKKPERYKRVIWEEPCAAPEPRRARK